MTLLSPKELFLQYPDVRKFFSTEAQLGSLLWLGLVRGRKKHRSCEICVEDVKRLIQMKRELNT